MNIHKTPIIIASLLVLIAAIPATLLLSRTPQDTRSKASASSTLYYIPSTTSTTPLQKTLNDEVALDVMINPGTNMASIIKLELTFDETKFTPAANPFVVNTSAFPTTIEGPVSVTGKVFISVSIGSDTTKAIQKTTKIGTLYLKATAPTSGSPTNVGFGTKSQILSVASQDEANENVLSTTSPTYVTIQGLPTLMPTATIVPSLLPSLTPTKAPTPTAVQLPTATNTPNATVLNFTVYLHGIGASGDNANPNASDMSNKNPLTLTREVSVSIYNDQNQLTATKKGSIIYDATQGYYKGTVDVGSNVPLGDYTVRIKDDTHLRRLIPGIQRLTPQTTNTMPAVALVAGDINNDNTINILDYNVLVGCYSDLLPAVDCDDTRKLQSDINDNGDVNQFDYNFFLREITVQAGN